MYIETSSPRQQGDKAKLNSPGLQFSGNMCLKFYYHMYGSDIATLNVMINGNNVFTASGDKGNSWLRAAIDVSLLGTYAVREIICLLQGSLFIPIVTTFSFFLCSVILTVRHLFCDWQLAIGIQLLCSIELHLEFFVVTLNAYVHLLLWL